MPRRVLNVGQCGFDHGSIRRLIQQNFDAEVVAADRGSDALAQLRAQPYDLVLINRKLDLDGSDGVKIIAQLKSDPDLKAVPVMLVSNYADAQEQATAAGAEPGFGKAQLGHPDTLEKLRSWLGEE